MPYGQPTQLANLKPFKPGNKQRRASAAKLRALTMCRLAAPECVEFALSVMRDPAEHKAMRLKAMDAILRIAFPARSVAHANLAENESPGPQYLEVVFVSPDGSRSDTPNFDGAKRSYDEVTQAGGDVAKVADEQPINDRRVTPPERLPPPRMVHDAEQEIPALPSQALRQDELILARPNGKAPSWRARNAAGIFR
jgi:hypothetical protein